MFCLVCRFQAKLEELGVDVQPLLHSIENVAYQKASTMAGHYLTDIS